MAIIHGPHSVKPDRLLPDGSGPSGAPLILSGRHILIVEDEFLIADDIAAALRQCGAEIVGPAASLPEGMRLASATMRIDAAVLNVNLNGLTVFPLADELQARGIRMMFLTGYGDAQIPGEYAAIPCCRKPIGAGCVVQELSALLPPIAA